MFVELDYRENHAAGIATTLWWNPETNALRVDAEDCCCPERSASVSVVDPAKALDVFRHPFAYA